MLHASLFVLLLAALHGGAALQASRRVGSLAASDASAGVTLESLAGLDQNTDGFFDSLVAGAMKLAGTPLGGKVAKLAAPVLPTSVAGAKDMFAAVEKCAFRKSADVAKDTEPLRWPAGWRACPAGQAAAHEALVAGRDTCTDGEFRTNSACMLDAVAKVHKLSKAQRLLVGDLYGGFLSFDMHDRDVLPGMGACLRRFKTRKGTDMWTVLTRAYAQMDKFWAPGHLSGPLHEKLVKNPELCNAINGPYCLDLQGAVEGNRTELLAKSAEKMLAEEPTFANKGKWMEHNAVSIRDLKGSPSNVWPVDNFFGYMNPNIELIQPCAVAGSFAYSEISLALCAANPAPAADSKKAAFTRDMASVYVRLFWCVCVCVCGDCSGLAFSFHGCDIH